MGRLLERRQENKCGKWTKIKITVAGSSHRIQPERWP